MKRQDIIKFSIMSMLTFLMYLPTFIWMWDRWFEKESYYGHGILIPLVCGFLVWVKKDRLKKIIIKPDNLGWLFLGVGLFIHLVSSLWRIYFTSSFSIILTLVGIVLLFFGRKFLREVLFPIIFLVFMMPLPLIAIAGLTFRMKILAAKIATLVVNMIGLQAVRRGSLIIMQHAQLMVENPCSGLRSLISLLALGALIAYLKEMKLYKKFIIFFSSGILAIIGNVFRITFLCFMSEVYGPKFAAGIYEQFAGMMVFVIAFGGLIVVSRLLSSTSSNKSA